MKVWIEVELHSNGESFYDIKDCLWLSFNSFNEEWIKMSEEYYRSTIEFNFMPIGLDKKEFNRISDYLKDKRERFNLKLNWGRPQFTWTHLHLFETSSFRRNRLLKWVLSFIKDNFDGLSKGSKERLLLAHQLWGFYDHKVTNGEWINIIRGNGFNITNYSLSYDKPKYSPVIKSPAIEGWKPLSTEIRCIPNEYIFNGKAYELCREIENGELYRREPLEAIDFFKFLIKDLRWQEVVIPSLFHNSNVDLLDHEGIIRLINQHWSEAVFGYSSICNWWNLRNVCSRFNSFKEELKKFRLINQRLIFKNINLLLNLFNEHSFNKAKFGEIKDYINQFDNDEFSNNYSWRSSELVRIPRFSTEMIIDFIKDINSEEKVTIINNLLISLEWRIIWNDLRRLCEYENSLTVEGDTGEVVGLIPNTFSDTLVELRNNCLIPNNSFTGQFSYMRDYSNININDDE